MLDTTLAVRSCYVAGGSTAGIAVYAGTGTIEDTEVRDTGTVGGSGQGTADGIVAVDHAIVTLTRTHVEGAARAGVSAFSANVTMSSSGATCNAIDLDGEVDPGIGDPYAFDLSAGANACGCDAMSTTCRVLSSGLAPPAPIK